jgi:hypothetical protein
VIIPAHCPECQSPHTERVDTEVQARQAFETRICNNCECSYRLCFGDPIVDTVITPEEREDSWS